ncbi:hypothetical protein FISHEDRAFT_73662 [Fistulina hepatica ATCC 64428]|uniref:ABC transporter domain-containing protein n=1 Tax=Fistulina hepatica ATCC 64428 TaxID=1128425 RepID=A0A0D7AF05_9AGAR|nr:hypothetical protein FISHEDRAFT_73662 [Fistulina hepatica ATCC 64428]
MAVVSSGSSDNSTAKDPEETGQSQLVDHSQEMRHYVGCQRPPSPTDSEVTQQGFDFEGTLRQVLKWQDKLGLKSRELGVVFDNLTVTGLGSDSAFQPTWGSAINIPRNIFRGIQASRHPQIRTILSGFEGVVKPGEMIVVLGNPGAGCSTFLKTIANQRGEYHSVTGNVEYGPIEPEELAKSFRGDAIYCPEEDIHFPSLTVEQTIRFAAKCRTPHGQQRIGPNSDCYERAATNVLLTVFGLNHARDTRVGDAMIRGISGGEKKRFHWVPTRGLDSSTALEFVQALRVASDMTKMTTVCALYQAGEPLYQLFDKVCVINDGRMVYFGPTDQAKQYFIDLGYEPAHRQTTADFLVSITDATTRTLRVGVPPGMVPRSASEFAQRFLESDFGQQNRLEIEEYRRQCVGNEKLAQEYRECAYTEHADNTRKSSPYITSIPMQARSVIRRRVQIIRGNPRTYIVFIIVHIYQAIIVGTAFYQLPKRTSDFFSRGGALFWALLFPALATMTEIPGLFFQRPIVRRQANWAWYHPFIDSLALTVVDIPITFMTMVVWTAILYFLPGFQISAGQVFTYLLFVFVSALTMKLYFRFLASMFAQKPSAQAVGGVTVLLFALYTGYLLPVPSMIGALKWINYFDPLRWGFESVLTNEFRTLDGRCDQLVPSGPGYENVSIANQVCYTVGALPGQEYVNGARYMALSYDYYWSNTWRNLGILIAFGIGFTLLLFLSIEYHSQGSVRSEKVLYNRDQRKKRHNSPLATRDPQYTEKSKSPTTAKDAFTFQHINYSVPVAGGQRRLLHDVSGYVAPGKLTALMGESGAGKTTLLNALAQRTDVGIVEGEALVNGLPTPADFKAQTGYCQQMDTHLLTDTVREALLFSAKLRQPTDVPLAEKEAFVDHLLKVCGLEEYQDAAVGSLPVEHKKRTTIAVELAAKASYISFPRLLVFLDEPTSGLDSKSAWGIVSFLRELADSGQAILCTIHQPSAELFQAFDRVLLLRKGGETVYFGDVGEHATSMIKYFETYGARLCQPDENPAEYMLDVVGAGATARSVQNWFEIWQKSPEASKVEEEIIQIHSDGRKEGAVKTVIRHEFPTPWLFQFKELSRRDFAYHWRNPGYTFGKIILNIVGGLFVGFTFFKTDDSQQGVQNKIMALFMTMILSFPIVGQSLVPFLAMRDVYDIREGPSRIYSWTALLLAQIISDLAWNVFGGSLYFLCWFWTIGFPTDRGGYVYLMLGIAVPFFQTTFGAGIAAMGSIPEIAGIFMVSFLSFVTTFNGVVQPYSDLGWWKWMYRASPFTYIIEGLMGYAVGHSSIVCSDVEFLTLEPPSAQTCGEYLKTYTTTVSGYLSNPDATSYCRFCAVDKTDDLLSTMFNIYYSHHWRDLGIVFAFVGFNVIAAFGLTWLLRIRHFNPIKSLIQLFKKA